MDAWTLSRTWSFFSFPFGFAEAEESCSALARSRSKSSFAPGVASCAPFSDPDAWGLGLGLGLYEARRESAGRVGLAPDIDGLRRLWLFRFSLFHSSLLGWCGRPLLPLPRLLGRPLLRLHLAHPPGLLFFAAFRGQFRLDLGGFAG